MRTFLTTIEKESPGAMSLATEAKALDWQLSCHYSLRKFDRCGVNS
jgi:hypothetical protein